MVIDNMTFDHVSSFKYLKSIVNETNKTAEEIQSRIAAGNRAHHANKKLLTNKLLSTNSKMIVYKTIVRPVVTYGSETWKMNTTHEEKLKIFERKILRSMYGPVQDINNEWKVRTNRSTYQRRKYSSIYKIPG
jgi:UDP-N-acetylmuramate-alanine ligase